MDEGLRKMKGGRERGKKEGKERGKHSAFKCNGLKGYGNEEGHHTHLLRCNGVSSLLGAFPCPSSAALLGFTGAFPSTLLLLLRLWLRSFA